jgi:hypothetical protein
MTSPKEVVGIKIIFNDGEEVLIPVEGITFSMTDKKPLQRLVGSDGRYTYTEGIPYTMISFNRPYAPEKKLIEEEE